ncbi:polymorphic toxin-type HINT domain-containing protein [Roseiconus nitratireducens]|nr:polymorphic toxin-type HINT domain-containing protein [Roseiconus nitratireducens]
MRQPSSQTIPGVKNRIAGAARNLGTLACLILAVCFFQPRLAALLPSPPTGLSTSENLQSASAHPIASTTPARRSKWITRPIEQLRCGDRIPAELPASEVSPPTLQPDPDAWRLIKLELIKENGQAVEVTLLRPLQWLRRAGAVTNGSFPVQLEELGIRGQAAVLDIGPCPHIQSGPGRLVTGTFRHVCEDLVRLRVAGSSDPITCTTGHPIWSEDRGEFVAAARLSVGEQLRLLGGRKTSVVGIEQLPRQPTRVCNLEVAGTHTYHVGTGLLVHNAVAKCGAEGGTQETQTEGSFSLTPEGLKGYPDSLPKPSGPLRLLSGDEYTAARKEANKANQRIRRNDPSGTKGMEIHEIQPVKFGGDPADPKNKVIISRDFHRKEVTPWWNRLLRQLNQ